MGSKFICTRCNDIYCMTCDDVKGYYIDKIFDANVHLNALLCEFCLQMVCYDYKCGYKINQNAGNVYYISLVDDKKQHKYVNLRYMCTKCACKSTPKFLNKKEIIKFNNTPQKLFCEND